MELITKNTRNRSKYMQMIAYVYNYNVKIDEKFESNRYIYYFSINFTFFFENLRN